MVKKVVVTFSAGSAGRSLTYELIKKYDIMLSIIKADIDAGRNGKLVLELDADEEHMRQAIEYMEESGVEVSPLENKIKYDNTRCISCGACTSSCLSGALSIQAPDWKVVFNPDKCIVCKHCVTACPLKLFSTDFAD